MRTLTVSVLSFATTLMLSACGSPTFMPAGYAHHNNVYKAQPGPEAHNLGYEYSAQTNADIVSKWENVAGQLIDELQGQSGIAPQAIYIHPTKKNAFNHTFDHALRTALTARGFTLVNQAGDAYEIAYSAKSQLDPALKPKPFYNGDVEPSETIETPPEHEFLLFLTLLQNGVPLGTGAGTYVLPSYGYEDGMDFAFGKTTKM